MKISIISASVRTGRKSDGVARYFERFINEQGLAKAEIIDLAAYKFPVFEERLKFTKDPLAAAVEFAERIVSSDGIIIVTPEYNGGYPAALKNAIDLLESEWRRKPIALVAVSSGAFGGTQVVTSLLFTLWKIGALMVPAKFHVPKVQDSYSEDGEATDKEGTAKRAAAFVDELLFWIKASKS